MKAITTLLATGLFVASAYAGSGTSDIYGGFAISNPDLFQWQPWQPSAEREMTGVQPAVGDAPYGWGGSEHNALFKSGPSGAPKPTQVDIYGGFAGPDLPSSY